MAWIESHQELARHPKLKRLRRLLGVSRIEAIGHLHLLWYWAFDYAPNGDLSVFTSDEIAEEVDWEGDAELLVSALVESGFLDRSGDRLSIHDNVDYNGKLQYQRERNRENQRRYREGQKDVTVTSSSRNGNVSGLPTNQPTLTNQPTNLSPPTPSRGDEEGEGECESSFSLFCELRTIDGAAMPAATRTKHLAELRRLVAKYGADDVAGCMRWLESWREVPWKPETVGKEIEEWIAEQRPKTGRRPPPSSPRNGSQSVVVSRGKSSEYANDAYLNHRGKQT